MEKAKMQNFKARAIDFFYAARELFGSVPFAFFETLAAIVVVLTMQEVAGAVAFVALIALKLVVCDDILPTTLPFLLLATLLFILQERRLEERSLPVSERFSSYRKLVKGDFAKDDYAKWA